MVRRTKTRKSHITPRLGKSHKSHKSRGKHMSIPDMRQAMHHMTNVCSQLHNTKGSHQEKVRHFQAEWRATFGKSLDYKAADKYLNHVHRGRKGLHKTHKMHGMHGMHKMRGGVFNGAPLDQITRQPVDTPLPESKYLPYVSGGFVNPEPGMAQSCGSQQGVMPYAGTGSNRVGGQAGGSAIGDFVTSMLPASLTTAGAALSFRPYVAERPNTYQQHLGTQWKGQPQGPGSESWQQAWKPQMQPNPIMPIPVAPALSRSMRTDTLMP